MGLFSAIVRTAVNTATLPFAVAKDVFTLGGSITDERPATIEKLEQIKREANDD